MFARRYFLWAIGAIAAWLFVVGCFTQLYRPTVNGTPEAMSSETLYDRYDSSAIDTTLKKEESYPSAGTDYYDRWDSWGRSRPMTRWGYDFYNYSPPYYSGYYGWEDYYGNPWWYSGYYDYWNGYPVGTGAPSEPASKRPFGRRDNTGGGGGSSPSVQSLQVRLLLMLLLQAAARLRRVPRVVTQEHGEAAGLWAEETIRENL